MKNKLRSDNLLLLLLWAVTSIALNAEAAGIDVKHYEGRKISRFQESGEFVWCGLKHLAISKHSKGTDAGIRLLDIESGYVRQLTTVKTHRVVACTPDGKHIFFVENGVHGVMNEFDIDKGKQQLIYSKNIFQHEVIEETPISPSGEFMIGPVTLSERVTLSDRTINMMHISDEFSKKHVGGMAWSGDGTALLVIDSDFGDKKNPQKLLILKYGNAHPRIIDLPSIRNAQFMQAGWSDVTKRLYLLTWGDAARLYEFDPEKRLHSLRLIATDVEEFKILPNGDLVYIQIFGVDYSKLDVAIIDQRAHRSLLILTAQGKLTELLKVPYKSLGISDIQVSPNGGAVAVRINKIDGRNDSMEIQVFTLEGN